MKIPADRIIWIPVPAGPPSHLQPHHPTEKKEGDTLTTKVWQLTIELDDGGPDVFGWCSLHASLPDAINTLAEQLKKQHIDLDVARWGETSIDGFVGNDVDPDLLDGSMLSWGINLMEVGA